MPDFPWRSDSPVPPAGDRALDELLTTGRPPQDAAPELQPVAAVLAALRAGPADGELAGQARALAEFRSTVRVSHRAGRRRARPVPFRERLSSKLAVITAATAVAVSGTMAAAYVGALPGPLQRAAHDVIAAPAVGASHGHPTPAAFGARRLHAHSAPAGSLPTGSAAVPTNPVSVAPGWQHDQGGSARKHYRHKRNGHHKGHRGHQGDHQGGTPGDQHGNEPTASSQSPTARYQGIRHGNGPAAHHHNPVARHRGNRHGDGPATRRDGNPKTHHKGSRLRSPLPKAAAFPNPPAGPDRPGAGGR
jgi:hypothetical protein